MSKYYSKPTSAGQALLIEEGTGRTVAVSYDQKDGPLLAAAPEMLEALEALTKHIDDLPDGTEKCRTLKTALNNRAGDLIRAAIEKARAE